jgi:hypothetical protein
MEITMIFENKDIKKAQIYRAFIYSMVPTEGVEPPTY